MYDLKRRTRSDKQLSFCCIHPFKSLETNTTRVALYVGPISVTNLDLPVDQVQGRDQSCSSTPSSYSIH